MTRYNAKVITTTLQHTDLRDIGVFSSVLGQAAGLYDSPLEAHVTQSGVQDRLHANAYMSAWLLLVETFLIICFRVDYTGEALYPIERA